MAVEIAIRGSTDHQIMPDTTAGLNVPAKNASPDIVDIRHAKSEMSLADDIRTGLDKPPGVEKTLPTLLMYDEAGLKLFEEITYLDEYYLTNAEIELLERNADDMAAGIESGSILLELGSGNLRKVNILLRALERHQKSIDYYALDCSLEELERTLQDAPALSHVKCHGLFGTYDDGLAWLAERKDRSKIVMSMGSSVGNFNRKEAAVWVRQFAAALGPEDRMLIGADGCKEAKRVFAAYNDSQGITPKFTLNALEHANRILGENAFDAGVWQATGEYDEELGCHRAHVVPRRDVTVLGTTIRAGEKVRIEESYKFDRQDLRELWQSAGVRELHSWFVEHDYGMHLIAKQPYAQPAAPGDYAAGPVPSLAEWDSLWNLWDTATRQMLPDEELLDKPIKLRNACIFYLGHIPTFLDIKITDTTAGKFTEPSYYPSIFERGIDPDVDNPEQCHAHSEIPDNWPDLDEILEYQRRVRDRVRSFYANGSAVENPSIARCLWLGYEHEAMHLETLLYILIQSEKTLAPPLAQVSDFGALENQAQSNAVPNKWFTIPSQDITINLDDPETDSGPTRYFGWDCEKPSRKVNVKSFEAKARPITNGEYAEYMFKNNVQDIPASWLLSDSNASAETNGVPASGDFDFPTGYLRGKSVRTVFGVVPLAHALSWPVSASYNELSACAAYMGGRIPTLEEARSIYRYADALADSSATQSNAKRIPAVNKELVNDGVPESPPSQAKLNGHAGPNPHELFSDLAGKNVGFQEWNPVSVVEKGQTLQGQGGMGGLWEWTSSSLGRHEGFEPMRLYEAYSQDFMDGKHNIVLGGSWATVPRIAGRKTFINWYQRNYPYVWAGARLVRDL